MGYRHRREDMLEAAKEIARSDGLGALSFGRVARQLGTNDRTVVYYFPSKAELIGAVLVSLGEDLQDLLAEAFVEEPLPPSDLGRRAWKVLARDETQPIFALFFEILGQAAVGASPFVDLAPLLVNDWLRWLEPRIAIADPDRRHCAALALLAQIDGLLLLRTAAGSDAAHDAAGVLGFC
ncbi:MAG: TetR/AcrR family transcriptional regulator [Candidatus Nanopelagicales bacterium]|nr:TetR/AcrR family transcriptional regulator [Candidatus Nanopelagicales bacterium]